MPRRPFNVAVNITQEYGASEPGSRRGYHTGVDYGMASGNDVVSPTIGTIHQNGDGRDASDGRGWFVTIVGDDGVGHCLYHLSQNNIVATGSRVSEGQLVGKSGNTGQSSGPHLHWETRRSVDNNTSDFAPADWLFAGGSPAPAPAAPATRTITIFGTYRTQWRQNADGSVGSAIRKIYPPEDGYTYDIIGQRGTFYLINSPSSGIGYINTDPSVVDPSLTRIS